MKLRNLFFASLAMVTFAACSNDNDPLPDPEAQVVDAGDVNINIVTKSSSTETKADTEKGQDGVENTVTSLKIYVFDGAGNYFTEVNVNNSGTPSSDPKYKGEKSYGPATISGLKTKTAYTFVAVANPPAIGNRPNLDALKTATLTFNPSQNFVMAGNHSIAANPGLATTDATDKSQNTFTIEISRRLAAVQLDGVTLKLPENTPDNFKAATAYLTDVYLVNVKSTAYLGMVAAAGSSDIEMGGENVAYIYGSNFNIDQDPQKKNFWGSKNTNLIVQPKNGNSSVTLTKPTYNEDGTISTTQTTTGLGTAVRLYAFPTSSINNDIDNHPIMLKLRVYYEPAPGAAEIADQVRYYTIYLKKDGTTANYGVNNNTLYKITATITGLGSKRDDVVEETAGDVIASIQVMPWEVKTQDEGNLTD